MDLGNLASLRLFYPELLLTIGTLAIILIDLVLRDKAILGDLTLLVAAGALLLIAQEGHGGGAWLFNRMLVWDSFALFFRALIALAALVAVWMSIGSDEVRHCEQGEYYAVLLASTLGMFLMAASVNLLMAYLSLEFVSLTSYVLTGILKQNRRSQEAALKYLIYGGVASGMMIYGMSWIYGLAGSLDFNVINRALFAGGAAPALAVFIALVLILAGMDTRSHQCRSICGRRTFTRVRRFRSPRFSPSVPRPPASPCSPVFSTPRFRIWPRAEAGRRSKASSGRNCCLLSARSR